MKTKEEISIFILIICLFFFIGFYKLASLPGEWFGDISILNSLVLQILSGKLPLLFIAACGPLYPLLIAPIVFFLGPSYMTYKILSLCIASIGLIGCHLFYRQILSTRFALVTTLLTATSFWYLVWTRLGVFNILTPLLTAFAFYFLLCYHKKKKVRFLIIGGVISSLGLLTYPGVFLLPIAYVAMFFLREPLIIHRRIRLTKTHGVALLSILPGILFFGIIVLHDKTGFTTGYIGAKVFTPESLNGIEILSRLIRNSLRTIAMLHIEGDIVFRWNIEKAPLLDPISGVVFLGGVYALYKKFRLYLFPFVVVMGLLVLLSISPTHPLVEVPSSSRTMAIIPFVFVIMGMGTAYLWEFFQKYNFVKYLCFGSILLLIFIFNMYRYFIVYPKGLPNENTPYGKIIAEYIDTLPVTTKVYLTASGWGDWGQPEVEGIFYALEKRQGRESIMQPVPLCTVLLQVQSLVLILDPQDTSLRNSYSSCLPGSIAKTYTKQGKAVFTVVSR